MVTSNTAQIFILTEGSQTLGFGHVSRCSALYQAFSEFFAADRVHFVVDGDDSVLPMLQSIPYECRNWLSEGEQFPSFIGTNDLVIVDSQLASKKMLLSLLDKTRLTAFIDDSRRITCRSKNGVIIDWTPFVEEKYPGVLDRDCEYLLGAEYISLRKSFWDVPNKNISENIRTIGITMGGGDLRNISPTIAKSILETFPDDVSVEIAVGRGFSATTVQELKEVESPRCKLRFYPDEKQMREFFLKADIVVSAGGQTLYELARVGTPTVAIEIIDNQREDVLSWQRAGFITLAGAWDEVDTFVKLPEILKSLARDFSQRKRCSVIGRNMVDGQGVRRIVRALMERISD